MDTEDTNGPIIENMKEAGSPTRCMVAVSSLGLTEESMKESTTTIRNKDTVYSHGRMEDNMMVTG
jgi:hypothetical protein